MQKTLDIEIEKAIRLIIKYLPISDENTRKPVLFHGIRVGTYLYEKNYSREIILAGFLHDTIEFSNIDEQMLTKEFGEDVTKIVLASTKNKALEKDQINEELIKRCAENGKNALIVKTADTIDSFKYYSKINNTDQLQNHCLVTANLIFKYLPNNIEDPIFDELKKWQEKTK